jgi:DNA sulfur modification protein DndD
MKFIEFEFEDYAAFYGRHRVVFPSPDEERNVLLIGGMNGAGKTNFIEGVVLCLYGFDGWEWWFRKGGGRKSDYHRRVRQALNERALTEGRTMVSLQLKLEAGGHRLRIRRRWWMSRTRQVESEDLQMWENGQPVEVGIDDPTERISRIQEQINFVIPPEVSPFFFFDAERVRSIAETNPAANIQEGLDRLLQLDALNTLIRHLEQIQRDLAKDGSTETDSEPSLLERQQEEVQRAIARVDEDIASINLEIDDNEEVLERLRLRLSELLNIGEDERNRISMEQANTRAQERQLTNEIGQALSGGIALALCFPLLQQLSDAVDELQRSRQTNQGRQSLAHHIERLAGWILSEEIPQPDPPFSRSQRQHIRERLLVYIEHSAEPDLSSAAHCINDLSDLELDDLERRLGAVDLQGARSLRTTCLRLEEARDRIRQLDTSLKRLGAANKESNPYLQQLEERNRRGHELETKLDQLQVARERSQAETRSLRERLRSAYHEATIRNQNLAVADRCRRILHVLLELRQAFRRSKVGRLEEHLNQMFGLLIHKDDLAKRISIDNATYEIRIFDVFDREIPPSRLSSGEAQVFAISFLWALARTSGADVPLIIDTPLGRLDSRHRSAIVTRYWPRAASQVVVLSTDEEVRGDYLRHLEPHLAGTLVIEYDPRRGTSHMTEGLLPGVTV